MSTGEELRDAGIARATQAANRRNAGWSEDAFTAAKLYIDEARGREFMAEDVRSFAERALGLPVAPDARAWGGVMAKVAKLGFVRRVDFRPSANPQAHKRPTAVWKAV